MLTWNANTIHHFSSNKAIECQTFIHVSVHNGLDAASTVSYTKTLAENKIAQTVALWDSVQNCILNMLPCL